MLKASRFGLGLVAAALVACGTEAQNPAPQQESPSFEADKDPLQGGFLNKAKSLDAVGMLGFKAEDGSYFLFCTATLIGPKQVLTAKHCAVELGEAFFETPNTQIGEVYYFVGPDAKAPSQVIQVIDTQFIKGTEGAIGLGLDVAVLQLAEQPKDVTPLTYAKTALDPALIGTKLVTVGYGTQDQYAQVAAEYGIDALDYKRRAGNMTQKEQSGNAYALLGLSKETYVQGFVDQYGEEFLAEVLGPDWKAILESWYDENVLQANREGVFGGGKGDAATAPGDSGGPTFRKAADGKSLEVVAVTSWGMSGFQPTQAGVFATLGSPEAQELLANSFSYVDPCAGGLTAKGSCDGTVATRCSSFFEGDRRALQLDCSNLLLECGTDANGFAGCVDPATGEVTGTPDAKPENAPTKEQIRANIAKFSAGQLNAKTRLLEKK